METFGSINILHVWPYPVGSVAIHISIAAHKDEHPAAVAVYIRCWWPGERCLAVVESLFALETTARRALTADDTMRLTIPISASHGPLPWRLPKKCFSVGTPVSSAACDTSTKLVLPLY